MFRYLRNVLYTFTLHKWAYRENYNGKLLRGERMIFLRLMDKIVLQKIKNRFACWVKRPIFWIIALLVVAFLLLPPARVNSPCSTVVEDAAGNLLGAVIATDGQWRFPEADSIPYKYEQCLLEFEDSYYYYHPGVNPISMLRAVKQNVSAGKVKSGGSTITMQLVRISRNAKDRGYWDKLYEMLLALRTELRYSKRSIIVKYASNAPFGGNVVGIEAASWRFFGVSPDKLSWAQSATLAVLPNAPGLIHPGRNRGLLLEKRNRLLKRLYDNGTLNEESYRLSLLEPLPLQPQAIPMVAPHLLTRAIADGYLGQRVKTTLDLPLQRQVASVVNSHYEVLRFNEINNAAAIVVDIRTGEVKAYVGNTNTQGDGLGGKVDIITSPRSYGSLLKPFLYAGLLSEGNLLPQQLVDDIPISIGGYVPQNFSRDFEGMIPADKALSRSLNIPFVILLRKYGMEKFNALVKRMGMLTISKMPDHYGLSIILGGAEGKLWDLVGMYSAMGATLSAPEKDKLDLHYAVDDADRARTLFPTKVFTPSSCWFTMEALSDVTRPTEDGEWRMFTSRSKVAWKTGTSFGFRDAWAVGVTPRYAVGVWVGNAGGDGRAGLMGVSVAAPIMFDIFAQLPASGWFRKPTADMQVVEVCPESGMKRGKACPSAVLRHIPRGINKTMPCGFHRMLHLDPTGKFQVTDKCVSVSEMTIRPWFVLPPAQEQFYRISHLDYKPMPPFMEGCEPELTDGSSMSLIYPFASSKMYLPRKNGGERSLLVLKAAHRNPSATIYWYLDETLVGQTITNHTVAINAEPGRHLLTLTDDRGESLKRYIEILGEEQR